MSTARPENLILEGLRQGEKSAIEELYKQHFPVIRSMITNNNGSDEDAADIFQEALIILFEKTKDADFNLNCLIRTYIFSVARNLWLKKLEKNRRIIEMPDGMEDRVATEEDIRNHEAHQLHFDKMEEAMLKIGEPCRGLIRAYYMQKKPMQQIAEEFGYTNADNAKTQKYKCLVRLKKLFFSDPVKK